MKKLLCALTATLLTAVVFAGCNNGDNASSTVSDNASSQTEGTVSSGPAANSSVPSPNSVVSGLASSVESMFTPSEASSTAPTSSME